MTHISTPLPAARKGRGGALSARRGLALVLARVARRIDGETARRVIA